MGTMITPWFEREAIDLEMTKTWKVDFLTGPRSWTGGPRVAAGPIR